MFGLCFFAAYRKINGMRVDDIPNRPILDNSVLLIERGDFQLAIFLAGNSTLAKVPDSNFEESENLT